MIFFRMLLERRWWVLGSSETKARRGRPTAGALQWIIRRSVLLQLLNVNCIRVSSRGSRFCIAPSRGATCPRPCPLSIVAPGRANGLYVVLNRVAVIFPRLITSVHGRPKVQSFRAQSGHGVLQRSFTPAHPPRQCALATPDRGELVHRPPPTHTAPRPSWHTAALCECRVAFESRPHRWRAAQGLAAPIASLLVSHATSLP